MAIQFKEHTSFLSTNNKNKIKVGELNCPIAAVTKERKVLVTQEQVVQAADDDFSSITLTATVVLMNEITEKGGNSWYRGKTYLLIKITATEPSSAMRNATELKETLLKK